MIAFAQAHLQWINMVVYRVNRAIYLSNMCVLILKTTIQGLSITTARFLHWFNNKKSLQR